MMEITREQFEDWQAEGFELRDDYSGRGMYGKNCIGLTGNVGDMIQFVIRVARDEAVDEVDWLEGVRSDNMGLDMIYYWPNVTVEDDEESE